MNLEAIKRVVEEETIHMEIIVNPKVGYSDTVKPVLSGHSKRRPKIGFRNPLRLIAGQKYCRMLHGEHPAILSTFIKLPFIVKSFVLSIFEWPLKTGFKNIFYCTVKPRYIAPL